MLINDDKLMYTNITRTVNKFFSFKEPYLFDKISPKIINTIHNLLGYDIVLGKQVSLKHRYFDLYLIAETKETELVESEFIDCFIGDRYSLIFIAPLTIINGNIIDNIETTKQSIGMIYHACLNVILNNIYTKSTTGYMHTKFINSLVSHSLNYLIPEYNTEDEFLEICLNYDIEELWDNYKILELERDFNDVKKSV